MAHSVEYERQRKAVASVLTYNMLQGLSLWDREEDIWDDDPYNPWENDTSEDEDG